MRLSGPAVISAPASKGLLAAVILIFIYLAYNRQRSSLISASRLSGDIFR
jgi:hypothetical protein